MSLETKHVIRCFKCDHEQEVIVADSLNSQLDPDAFKKAVNYEEMIIKCDKCGAKGFYDHPLLYHDPIHHFMIQYSTNVEFSKDFIKQDNNMKSLYNGLTDHYIMRICDYYPDFIEKIMILTNNYNDIVMEQYKMLCYFKVKQDFKDSTASQIHYINDLKGNEYIQIILNDDKELDYEFEKKMYYDLEEEMKNKPYYKRNDNYIVNPDFIIAIFKDSNCKPLHYDKYNIEEINNNKKEDEEKC